MSLLAAAVPVAVLVLAWDETAPAVRALLEAADSAAPTLDSVVVLVPAATGEPTQEEFLPLHAEPIPNSAAVEAISAKETAPAGEAEVLNEAAPTSETALPLGTAPLHSLPSSSPAPLMQPVLGTGIEAALPEPAALLAAVRLLSLSSFSLPELSAVSHQALPRPIWQGSWAQPAAPYLGSEAAITSGEAQLTTLATPQPTGVEDGTELAENELLPSPTLAAQESPATATPAQAPTYPLAELTSLDAEADLAPIAPDELTPGEATPAAPAPTSAQADWIDALASLRTPLPIEEPAPATDLENEAAYYAASVGEQPAADNGPAELRPPTQPFAAPDLNFQVIQYARFAVPVALVQVPFAAIYAPAWPTWLAAQELRYRTRQPLVLHVTTLAAGADESVITATSWQAELQRQALQRADLILAETPELTRRLRHDLGLPPELVRTVPATDAAAVAQALRTAQLRPTLNPS